MTLIDTEARPGGVCLFQGCIASKILLHLTDIIQDARHAAAKGVTFGEPQIDLGALQAWKDQVIDRLANGLVDLSKKRDVQLVQAWSVLEGSDRVRLHGSDLAYVQFEHAILATGSHPIPLPGSEFKEDRRVMNSTSALALVDIPETLLVVGGGYVGLELGSVYASLGSRVTVVEATGGLLPGTDRDLVKPLACRAEEIFEAIYPNTRVTSLEEHGDRVEVMLEGEVDQSQQAFDRVLVAIGRWPASQSIGLETTAVEVDERGFVVVDKQQRTADERIFAVGDVAGAPMLAYKAIREGKVAAEVIAGEPATFGVRCIPTVLYTDPQIAWCGLLETEAREQGHSIKVGRFPWVASGRALTIGITEGLTKIVFDADTKRVLGVGIVGRGAEDMIAEGALAVEMGALAQDLALTVHPHPTLSETVAEAAEAFLGRATHILSRNK